MNSKTTWTCVAIAGLLFGFIFFVEHPFREQDNAARTTKIFRDLKTNAATQIEVLRAGHWEIRAERTNDSWLLTSPLIYPAAPEKIEKLFQALADLNWQARITPGELKSRPKAQEEFGFATPLVSLTARRGEEVLVNLLIGTNTPVGRQIYLQVVGDAGVYLVDSEFLNFLPQSPSDWRDPNLLRLPPSINVIKARAGNKIFALTRTNQSWRVTAPQQAHADDSKILELLKKTAALQISKFETDNPQPDLDAFGLLTPELEISFATDTNIFATLQVGRSPTNDPSQVFARLPNQNHIFLVPREPLEAWRGSPTNFIDRSLVNFPTKDVAQIDVRGDDQFTLQRAGNSWAISGVTNFLVDSDLVREVLNLFSRAQIDFEKDPVTDFASYGLAPPALEYTLRTVGASNPILAQIVFGTNQSEKVFVRRLDEYPDAVNSMQADIYARLPRASWQFRDRRIWSFTSNEVASVTIHQQGRERKIIRNAKGEWTFAPGSQGMINPFSFNELLYRLGELRAVFWISPDEKNLDRFGFKEADHTLAIELKRSDKTETLSLQFGGFTEFGTRYTAITRDGARMIFEFPWPLFMAVEDSLSVPKR